MASTIHSGCRKNGSSSSGAGVMWLRAPTTTTGASGESNARFDTVVATVCRNEPRSTASEASTRRPVFLTDSISFVVERATNLQVDDFSRHSVLALQNLGGLHRAVQGCTQRGDGDVGALATDRRLTLGGLVPALGNAAFLELLALVVQHLRLEEHHRVGAAQRQVQHALGVGRGRREVGLQAGDVQMIAAQSCECCAPYLLPTETRSTSGMLSTRRHRRHLAIWLNTSSPARPRKSQYISSTTARTTAQRVTDARADDRGLGDQRVEQTACRAAVR